MNTSLDSVNLWVLAPILMITVPIMLWALIDVIRRPAERMRALPKWAWVVVVVFGNTLGQLIYLFFGRDTTKPVAETRGTSPEKAASAADALYGPSGDDARGAR